MQKIKALLFDLDGTLIDSEFFHFECWNEILQEYGVALTYNEWLTNYAGNPLPKNAEKILKKYEIEADLEAVVFKRENLTIERLLTKDVNLMPFAIDFIEFFYNKGLKLAIVTSSPRKDVEAIFERNGLGKYFSLMITRTEVSNSKPDPESYNMCIDVLGLDKSECIIFEDTLTGVKAGLAAGISTYAIQNNIRAHQKLRIADQLFLNFAHAKDFIMNNKVLE